VFASKLDGVEIGYGLTPPHDSPLINNLKSMDKSIIIPEEKFALVRLALTTHALLLSKIGHEENNDLARENCNALMDIVHQLK
jgi:hypothetical protein